MKMPKSIPQTAASVIITDLLLKALKPSAIYVVGSRKQIKKVTNASGQTTELENHHFTLLVFAKDIPQNATGDTANTIAEKTKGTVTATFLLHKPTELKPRPGEMPYFFYNIMNNAMPLYVSTTNPPFRTGEGLPVRDVQSTTAFWLDRQAVANLMYDAAAQSEHIDLEVVRATMLHTAVENTCLGLIRIFYGYRPNHYNLGYLFDLLETVSPLPAEIFPRQTPEELRLFKLLAAHTSLLRHRGRLHMDETDFALLLKRTKMFIERAAILADVELESLKSDI